MTMDAAGRRCAWRLLTSRGSPVWMMRGRGRGTRARAVGIIWEVDPQCPEPHDDVDRSDLAVSLAVPEWHRVRAAGVRQEAAALAARDRGPAVHGVSLRDDNGYVARGRRSAARRGVLVRGPTGLVVHWSAAT